MLPRVRPLTSSPKTRPPIIRGRFHKTSAAHRIGGPHVCSVRKAAGLRDPDEDSLHRVVDAEWLLDHVAVPVEGDGKAEQRRRGADLRRLDLTTNLGAGGLAVLAGAVDCAYDDLRRDVARAAEELGVAPVALLEGRDPLVRRIQREERVIDVVPEAREQRIEEAV